MDWLDKMNNALDYIEENLSEEIEYSQVAKIACCSTYHFQRMFSYISNISLSEYIRRRRLTLAAFDLQNSDAMIIDLALKYGYEAPEAFSRAFKSLHGITPSSARNDGVILKAYPRMTFLISIKGDIEMNYKIEEKPAFTVFGVEKIISLLDGANYKEVPEFWSEYYKSGKDEQLHADVAIMCYEHIPQVYENEMDYLICKLKKSDSDTKGFKEVTIPAATWAIFSTDVVKQITEPIQNVWERIFTEWFPTSNYEHAPLPDCEFYYETEEGEYAEVWIPVLKK